MLLAHRTNRFLRQRLGVDIPLLGEERLGHRAGTIAVRHHMDVRLDLLNQPGGFHPRDDAFAGIEPIDAVQSECLLEFGGRRQALEKGLVRGRSIEAIVAAAVYAACRIDGVPRTLDELQQVTGVRKKTIGKAYGALLRTLTLRVPPSRPTNYVSRFCSRLGLSNTVEAEAQKILKELEKIDSSMSLSPSGTAAAAIYLASLSCGERRPQKAIAKIAGVSEVTLRNRFQFMEGFMQQLVLPRGRAPKIGPASQGPP